MRRNIYLNSLSFRHDSDVVPGGVRLETLDENPVFVCPFFPVRDIVVQLASSLLRRNCSGTHYLQQGKSSIAEQFLPSDIYPCLQRCNSVLQNFCTTSRPRLLRKIRFTETSIVHNMEAHSQDQGNESYTAQPNAPLHKRSRRGFIDPTLAEPLGDTIDAMIIYPCIAYVVDYLTHRALYTLLCTVIVLSVLFNLTLLMTTAAMLTIFTFSGVITVLILDS